MRLINVLMTQLRASALFADDPIAITGVDSPDLNSLHVRLELEQTWQAEGMTNDIFQIDGALVVQDAQQTLAGIMQWIDAGGTALDIAPVAPATGLPGQVALQLLLAAEREIVSRGKTPGLTDAARAILQMAASPAPATPLDRSAT